MKRFLPLSASALALALITACGSGGVSSAIGNNAYQVNSTTVSRTTFENELKEFAANAAFVTALGSASQPQPVKGTATNTINAAFVRETLGFDLLFTLINQEVKTLNLTVDPSTTAMAVLQAPNTFGGTAAWNGFPQDFRARETTNIANFLQLRLSYIGLTKLDDAAIKATYDKDPTVYATRCFSHILVATQAESTAIAAQLASGSDFATIAKAKSTDTGSGANGGDITSGTCQSKTTIDGQYVKEFSAAVDAAKLNVPTAPFQSQYGWHIVLVTKVEQPAFDTVKDAVSSTVMAAGNPKFQAFEKDAYAKAKIQIDPRYGVWDPTTNSVIAGSASGTDIAVK